MTKSYPIHKHHSPQTQVILDWISLIYWGLFFFIFSCMVVFFGPRIFMWIIALL